MKETDQCFGFTGHTEISKTLEDERLLVQFYRENTYFSFGIVSNFRTTFHRLFNHLNRNKIRFDHRTVQLLTSKIFNGAG